MNKIILLFLILLFLILLISTPSFVIAVELEETMFIPDVLQLKDEAILSKDIIDKFTINQIADSLVMRIHNTRESNIIVNNPQYDYLRDTDLQIAFHSRFISSIKKSCFQNQHQTGMSYGTNNGLLRSNQENFILGIKLEDQYSRTEPLNTLRPKYAYLGILKPSKNHFSKYVPKYGNIIAVFKDEIKRRATFSTDDSLGLKDVNEIKTFFYRSEKPLEKEQNLYWEAQIWGEICIKDVDHFLINCRGFNKASNEAIQELLSTNVEVHECIMTPYESGYVMSSGKIISK